LQIEIIMPLKTGWQLLLTWYVHLAVLLPSHGQTVFNIPPDTAPRVLGADTLVNLLPGGTLVAHNGTIASSGAIVNVLGGRVGELVIETTSEAHVEGGGVHGRFWVADNGTLFHDGGRTGSIFLSSAGQAEITGGAIETIGAVRTSSLIIRGVDFAIDGVPVGGLGQVGDSVQLDLGLGTVLTATLADGTPFGRYQSGGAQATIIENGVLTLERSVDPQPPVAGTLIVEQASDLPSVGANQLLQVVENGSLPEQFRAGPGSLVEVNGGQIGAALHAVGAEVVLNEGRIRRRMNAFDDAVVSVRGGLLESDAQFFRASTLNVEGGEVGGGIWFREGAELNLRSGRIFEAIGFTDSDLNIEGGTIHRVSTSKGRIHVMGGSIIDSLDATNGGRAVFAGGRHTDNLSFRGAQMEVHGSEMRINGVPLAELVAPGDTATVDLSKTTTLSGVYADGTPFVLHGSQEDVRSAITVVETPTPAPASLFVRIPSDPVPPGVRDGQVLLLEQGGSIPSNFTAGFGSTLEVRGGTVGSNLEVIGATLDATGGQFSSIEAFTHAEIDLGGTAEFTGLSAYDGAIVNVRGALYTGGSSFRAWSGAEVNISGGVLRGRVELDESTVSVGAGELVGVTMDHFSNGVITGGEIGGVILRSGSHLLATGGTINSLSVSIGDSILEGVATTTATIDGAAIENLVSGPFTEITIRSGIAGNTDVTPQGGSLKFFAGVLDDRHQWLAGTVEINGYGFQVNGEPVSALQHVGDSIQLQYEPGSALTGQMADGTPFNLMANDNFNNVVIADGVLTLIQSAPVVLPDVVTVPRDTAPYGAATGQTVILEDGGALGPHFVAAQNSVVEIRGGTVGKNFEADRSFVTIAGGTVGEFADVFRGATVTVTGGEIRPHLEVHAGGVLNLNGGQLGFGGVARGGQLNMAGGRIVSGFELQEGASASISGGLVDGTLTVAASSTATVSGGEILRLRGESGSLTTIEGGIVEFDAQAGAFLEVRGGIVDRGSIARVGSTVEVRGGVFRDAFVNLAQDAFSLVGTNFEIDGVAVADLDQSGAERTVTVETGQLIAGILQDGSPFVFSRDESDSLETLRLVRSSDLSPGAAEIHVASDVAPSGVRGGQTLTLFSGGTLPDSFGAARNSIVNLLGGTVEENFEAYYAEVNIEGGTIGNGFDAFGESTIHVRGGAVGFDFAAHSGSEITMSGGRVEELNVLNGASLTMEGGHLSRLRSNVGAHTQWKGGTIGAVDASASASARSTIDIFGVGFEINGVAISGLDNEGDRLALNLPAKAVLTATLSDGSPLVVGSPLDRQQLIGDGTLTLIRSAQPEPQPVSVFEVNDSDAPIAVGNGQKLSLLPGGTLPTSFIAGAGSQVEILGGEVRDNFRAFDSEVDIVAGNMGAGFTAMHDTRLTVTGGTFGADFTLLAGARSVIRGGAFPEQVTINVGAVVDIFGTSFLIGGEPISQLKGIGDSYSIRPADFNGDLLTAVLLDGAALKWSLSRLPSNPRRTVFGILSGANVRLHLVPEPCSWMLIACCVALPAVRRASRRRMVAHARSD
jgi:hypothetical protein